MQMDGHRAAKWRFEWFPPEELVWRGLNREKDFQCTEVS